MSFAHYYVTTFSCGREHQVLRKKKKDADKLFKAQCDAAVDAKINPDTDVFLSGFNKDLNEVQIIQTWRNYGYSHRKRK